MKFTLAFHVFNKEDVIENLLDTWISKADGEHALEVIVVCDDLQDRSDEIAGEVLEWFGIEHRILYALNGWEIGCDNLALAVATGDVIVFIQDDNWMYTRHWDHTLAQTFERVPNVGAVGLLAGGVWQDDGSYRRVECWAKHKGEMFTMHNIPPETYPPAIWQVDFVTRPLAVRVNVARKLHGFDWAYWPMDWDETDFSWRCQLTGYTNVVLPFDLLNTVTKKDSVGQKRMVENFERGRRIFMGKHAASIPEHCIGGQAIKLEDMAFLQSGRLRLGV